MGGTRPPPIRCHMEAFAFMRTSALQRRRFLTDQEESNYGDDARVSLLRREEEGLAGSPAPSWTGKVEGLNYQMTRAEGKVAELDSMHTKHLSRPSMEESDVEENAIQKLTGEITTLFAAAQKQLVVLRTTSRGLRGREKVMVDNIVTALVSRLQGITERFRASQGNYLRRVEAREKRSSQYFSSFQGEEEEEDDGLVLEAASGGWGQQDMMMMEDHDRLIRKRENEIHHIVQSIQDLNTIFKELAGMVAEQGEVVDRIEVNIEQASIKVEHGLKELQQASKYQKQNRKLKCILCLGPSLIVMLILLIIVKS